MLLLRTHHSLLFGTCSPAALVEAAAARGVATLVLADRESTAGRIEFLEACAAAKVRGVLGVEITPPSFAGAAPSPTRDGACRAPGAPPPTVARPDGCNALGSVLLIAEDDAAYGTVCRIASERHLQSDFDIVRSLQADAAGVLVLCEEPRTAERLRGAVPPDRLFVRHAGGASAAGLERAAAALGTATVALPRVTFLDGVDFESHRILRAAALGKTSAELGPRDLAPSGERLDRAVAPFPLAPAFAALLSPRSAALPTGRPIFPRTPLPSGVLPLEHLQCSCLEGLARLGADTARARARLARELEIIAKLGFVEYFVIVGDIVRAARAFGIPTVGRGSGASALVAYALGITNVNPLHYDLVFERFLHEKRADCPDLDIDLCWRGRDDVIEHVYKTYGRDRVAMISTHVLFHPRSAFREAARAAGVPPKRIDSLSKLLPSTWETAPFGKRASDAVPHTAHSLRERILRDPHSARAFAGDPRAAAALTQSERLLGIPRHLGIHSGGIVIADRPLTAYTALAEATKGIVVTQHEMRAIEKIGLVKIDLLGNRALSVLRDTVDLVRRHRRQEIDLERIPETSEVAAQLLAEGDALGVFQVESPGMRNLLRQLRPRDLDGVIDALSLIRPGPAGSGMKDLFVLRARGLEAPARREPRLDRLLASNHGILLYEEDVMRVVALVADVPLADADGVRRAIGKAQTIEEWQSLERWFVARALGNGYTPDVARSVWGDLARFGAYAFCKAHASGYGVLGHRMAHVKALYPAEFAVAFLNNGAGMYPPRVHVEDARRRGVAIFGPCVGRSWAEFTVERGEGDARQAPGAPRAQPRLGIRVGLASVAGLSQSTIAALLAARDVRPFASLEDFLRRTRPTRPEAEALVLCGACDVFGENRPRLLWRLLATLGAEREHAASDPDRALFSMESHRTRHTSPALPDHSPALRAEYERTLLGFPIEAHPLAGAAPDLRRAGVVFAADLLAAPARYAGRRIRVCGLASARRRFDLKSGDTMMFLTLEDSTGLVECTIFPNVYRRAAPVARRGGFLRATGRVEDHLGAVTLTVEELSTFEGGVDDRTQELECAAQRCGTKALEGVAELLAGRTRGTTAPRSTPLRHGPREIASPDPRRAH